MPWSGNRNLTPALNPQLRRAAQYRIFIVQATTTAKETTETKEKKNVGGTSEAKTLWHLEKNGRHGHTKVLATSAETAQVGKMTGRAEQEGKARQQEGDR